MGKIEPKYSKEQIAQSKKFKQIEKDILNALLEENKSFTLNEIDAILGKYTDRKKVK